ncbi:hypothetical protein D0T53_07015 [Dysgonomonas sp. 216]|uniref:hypothetical protein n=1 Tax=Dysgonomonas sp. 216 TaxID=2302934 RepID=UPI0013D44E1C|nr:hypothetical protein [Dysgonomonas sp. 216]NDW18296.1 hypothetical protein [Dysgonomonas sp. 216]NDW18664.1 hypothetical protein [Dysgonomonas sp. 216]
MKKRLQQFAIIALTLTGFLSLNSCGDDITELHEHYYEDPSTYWDIVFLTVGDSSSGEKYKWKWNSDIHKYYCVIPVSEISEKAYDYGAILAYTFYGKYDEDETQHQLRHYANNGAIIDYDISYDMEQTICFYYYWDDYMNTTPPPTFNFKVVLLSPGKLN